MADDMAPLDAKLEEMLADAEQAIVLLKAICAESKERQVEQKLAQAMVLVCNANGIIEPILEWALKHEVECAVGQPNTLFRSNTMTVRMVADHIRHSASVYLVNTLHSPIHRILEHPRILTLDVEPRYTEKVKPAEIKKRFQILIGFADQLLNSIFDSLEDSPRSVRRLLRQLYERVTEHFPAQGSMAVGGFVFLRFLCPAIVSPEKFFLTSKDLEPEARRVLLLMSKTLIQLANEMEFQDTALAPLNSFINDYQMLVVDWLVRFATQVSLGSEETEGELGSGDHIEVMKVTKEARAASFDYIRWCLQDNKESVCKHLPEEHAVTLGELLEKHGGGLSPIDAKSPLLDSHDKHYQLIKHAVFAQSQLNSRHTLDIASDVVAKSPKVKTAREKRRSIIGMAGMGKARVKRTDSSRSMKDKVKDKEKESGDSDSYRVHNELLLIRVKELEAQILEATGQPAVPAPYLQMFDKGVLTAANLSMVQQMSDAPSSPKHNQSPRSRFQAPVSPVACDSPRRSPRTIALDGSQTVSTIGVGSNSGGGGGGGGGGELKKLQKDVAKVKKSTDAILELVQQQEEWKNSVLERLAALEHSGSANPKSVSQSQ